jgi:hypothetical protein
MDLLYANDTTGRLTGDFSELEVSGKLSFQISSCKFLPMQFLQISMEDRLEKQTSHTYVPTQTL